LPCFQVGHESNRKNPRTRLWQSPLLRAVLGLNSAASLIHFWLDAFVWRMSDKNIRALHGDAFAF
jgi:hypothetical protein